MFVFLYKFPHSTYKDKQQTHAHTSVIWSMGTCTLGGTDSSCELLVIPEPWYGLWHIKFAVNMSRFIMNTISHSDSVGTCVYTIYSKSHPSSYIHYDSLYIPSSSSSLYIWNQGLIVTWYIGNWEQQGKQMAATRSCHVFQTVPKRWVKGKMMVPLPLGWYPSC